MEIKEINYSDKPLGARIVFFLLGFTNVILGYAIYYWFKDDKSKQWQVEFIQRGASFCLAFLIIAAIIGAITPIIMYLIGA